MTCDPPPPIFHGSYYCTDGFRFDSICRLNCSESAGNRQGVSVHTVRLLPSSCKQVCLSLSSLSIPYFLNYFVRHMLQNFLLVLVLFLIVLFPSCSKMLNYLNKLVDPLRLPKTVFNRTMNTFILSKRCYKNSFYCHLLHTAVTVCFSPCLPQLYSI